MGKLKFTGVTSLYMRDKVEHELNKKGEREEEKAIKYFIHPTKFLSYSLVFILQDIQQRRSQIIPE